MAERIINLDETGAWVKCGVLPLPLSECDFERLWTLHPAEFGKVVIHGKEIFTPRWQQTYLRDYWYTGMMHKALPLPDEFRPYLEFANQTVPQDEQYNQVLINWYESGLHYISAHSDAERQLVPGSYVFSISLGATRTFRIRDKATKQIVQDIPMEHGTYLVMGGNMQEKYTHEVPKVMGKKGEAIGRRINITFRRFK